ncbi:MAG: hypothetical protein GTN71_10815 [Anaerolineae bacterium]|nr:hypothetical protein [Anaerolineae bacterium]
MRPEVYLCTWCGAALQAPETTWLVNAQIIKDLPEHEGESVPFKLVQSGRTITGFLATSASPAKREGVDMIFATCGQECASALKAAVREEVDNLGLVIS